MAKTQNYKLQKDSKQEFYNIDVVNSNLDIIDAEIKKINDSNLGKASQVSLNGHVNNKNNPHKVTKEQLGLNNVVNRRQMYGITAAVTTEGIPVFDGNGCTVKDSGFTIKTSVPENAKFTDTLYTHPLSRITPGEYKSVSVDVHGHVFHGSNPTTLEAYGITDAEPKGSADAALAQSKEYADEHINSVVIGKVDKISGMGLSEANYTTSEKNKLTTVKEYAEPNSVIGVKGDSETEYRVGQINISKDHIGLSNVDNKSSNDIREEITKQNITSALGYTPEIEGAYQNATAYTDTKIKELAGISSDALENINKLAEEIANNQDIIDTLTNSITAKANQSELDTHTGNDTIHVTATDKANLSSALSHVNGLHARTDATKVESSSINGNVKINGTDTKVYTHPIGTNPHGTTKNDIGLGNVPNVDTDNQTPTFTEPTALTKLISGEKLTIAFGKISKAVSILISHIADASKHFSLTNNLTTTNTGTALDAVQGKVLDDRITELNNNFPNIAYISCVKGEKFKTGTGFCIVRAGICFLTLETTPVEEVKHGDIVVTGLPRPSYHTYVSLPLANGNCYSAQINAASGNLVIYYPSYVTASRIDVTLSYPVSLANYINEQA